MAEDQGDKTEAPTARRRQESREQGNFAKSQDLVAAVLLLGMFLLLNAYGGQIVSAMQTMLRQVLEPAALGDHDAGSVKPEAVAAIVSVAQSAAPVFIGVMVLGIVANMAQVGLFFSPQKLQPDLSVLNPLRGLSRMFQGPGMVRLVMNLLKLALVAFVAWSAVHDRLAQIVAVEALEAGQIFALGASVLYSVALRLATVLLILALIDYAYHRLHLERELRMSKQEVKEEMRNMDGDPKVKQRRRQIALQAAGKKLAKDVPTADVVVTNPTEFAIALKYDAKTMHAPRVVAKGQDLIAQRIREIAIANGIPILERKPLARALFKLCNVGQEIPEQFYSTVAEILAYVYELTGKTRKKVLSA